MHGWLTRTRDSEGNESFLDEEGEEDDDEARRDALRAGHHRLLVRQQRHGGAQAPDQKPAQVPVHAAAAACCLPSSLPVALWLLCSDAIALRVETTRRRILELGMAGWGTKKAQGQRLRRWSGEGPRSQLMKGPEGRAAAFKFGKRRFGMSRSLDRFYIPARVVYRVKIELVLIHVSKLKFV
jgi:hypothetical protein